MTEEKEKLFKCQLFRLYRDMVIKDNLRAISEAVNKEFEKAKRRGIDNYYDWMNMILKDKEAFDAGKKDIRCAECHV